ncbi:hypothetical protein [Nocardia sp. CDC160]|uniref:hypothetical protein n=1 Tax=Nocardia sp. CDC160 TaxID=3112166 RepID=UPI002DBA605D|nr:hypothetical protein [Nocardia sp. CDC160]MEC3919357.1 hypothetical protein [Nocardia sp. CDC160]
MSITRRTLLVTAALAAGASVAGMRTAAAQSGDDRTEAMLENDDGVLVSEVTWYAPMPADALPHPPECDYLSFLRFRWADGPADPAAADAVLSTQAGAAEGPASLDPLARNTVRELAARGIHAEFWVMDRRDNTAKDSTGFEAAVAAQDYRVAYDYYFGNRPVNGRTFDGFTLTGERANVLADVGLRRVMEDWHFINSHEIPDPVLRRRKLFVGGHSYGGQITALYLAWDFGDRGDVADAGCGQSAGYVSFDGPLPIRVVPDNIPAFSEAVRMGWDGPGQLPVGAVNEGLRLGVLPRTVALPNIFDGLVPKDLVPTPAAEIGAMLNIFGLAARFAPDDESIFPRELPRNWKWELLGRIFFGGDPVNMLTQQTGFRDFRMTNMAVLGGIFDGQGLPFALAAPNFGTLDGGPVAERKFPIGPDFNGIPLIGWATSFLTWQPRFTPTSTGHLYTWRNYDRMGEPFEFPGLTADGRSLNSPIEEHCDANQIARACGTGRLGYLEPYVSAKQYTDEIFMLTGDRSGDFRFIRFEDFRSRVPGIQMVSAQLWGKFRWIPGFIEPDAILIDHYSHSDMINAAAVQNDGRPDQVMWNTVGFIQRTLGR